MLRPPRGFTLLELLSTLTVASILLSLAVSAFSGTIRSSRLNSGLEALLHTLDRTRSLAVARGKRAAFCITDETDLCDPEWKGNYLTVFIDNNQNRVLDEGEEIFIRQPWEPTHLTLTSSRPKERAVIFQPDGTAVFNCTLNLQDDSGKVFKRLILSKVGRTRIE